MERTNHSSSTTWRRQLRREPFLGRGGCAICSGALAHWGRGDAPPPALACKSPPHSTQCIHSWPRPIYCLAPAPSTLVLTPPKNRKIHSLWTLAFRQRTYREDPGVVSLSLLTQSYPKHREHTRPSGLGQQLRERQLSAQRVDAMR